MSGAFDRVNNDIQSILCTNARQEEPSSDVHVASHEIQNSSLKKEIQNRKNELSKFVSRATIAEIQILKQETIVLEMHQ
jgi:hypothetical protein